MIVIAPEHLRIYTEARWSKSRVMQEFEDVLVFPGRDMIRGAHGVAEGMPETAAGQRLPKFRPGGLTIVRAGGEAGLMSAIIGGWAASGERGSDLVTKEIGT